MEPKNILRIVLLHLAGLALPAFGSTDGLPLVANLKLGTAIAFEFVERAPGEWVITKIAPRGGAVGSNAEPATHKGH